jgi:hypothetical protein
VEGKKVSTKMKRQPRSSERSRRVPMALPGRRAGPAAVALNGWTWLGIGVASAATLAAAVIIGLKIGGVL